MNQNNLAGLKSMVSLENSRWTKSYNWLKSSILWLVLVNGMILLAMSQTRMLGLDPTVSNGLDILLQLFSGMCPIGAIIVVHGSIIHERDNGTLAWVLSGPVARKSIILSKLGVNVLYTTSIIVVLQSIVSQGIIQYFSGESISLTPYYLGVAQIALYIVLWVSYTIMLGVLLRNRSVVMGVALCTMFFLDIVANLIAKVLPFVPKLMPSSLLNSAAMTIMGGDVSATSILVALGWIASFILVAVLSFEKEEL